MNEQSAVICVLYLAAVAFFALWRSERARANTLSLFLWDEIGRHQMARLRAREDEEFDAIREIV